MQLPSALFLPRAGGGAKRGGGRQQKGKEEAGQRIYTVALRLMAERASGTFVGEARLVYTPQGGEWKLAQVGLLSLAKAE